MSLSTRHKVAFGFGSLAFGIKDQGFNTLLLLYYNQVVGLPAAQVGAAILFATLVDAVLDPLIGHASDHYRSRLGRRHPFMYGAALPMAIAYALFWSPPDAAQSVQLAWLVSLSIVVRVAISLYEIPSTALMAELTNDYDERTTLSTWRSLFMGLALVGMGIVVFKYFLAPTAQQPVGQLNAEGYVRYGYVGAALMFVSVLVAARGTHDRIPMLRASIPERQHGSLWSGLKLLMTDRAYVSVVLCAFLFAVGGGIATTLGTYLQTYFWKVTANQIAAITAGFGAGLPVGLIVSAMTRHLNKKLVTISACALALIAFVALVTLRLTGVLGGDVQAIMPWLIAQSGLMAVCLLVTVIMSASMLADVADHIEVKTGRRMEGLMFAALIMIQKAVSGFGVFCSSIILTLVGFPEKADPATIDPTVVHHLALVYVTGTGVMVFLSLLAISIFPISRESHRRTLEMQKAMRAGAAIAHTAYPAHR